MKAPQDSVQWGSHGLDVDSNITFCDICHILGAELTHRKNTKASSNEGDVFMGSLSQVESKSTWCGFCRVLMGFAHSGFPQSESQDPNPVSNSDIIVTAHLFHQNPAVAIVMGSSAGSPAELSIRRQQLPYLAVTWLFTFDENASSTDWPSGKPRSFLAEQLNYRLVKRWLEDCESQHGARCKSSNIALLANDVDPNFIDVDLECISPGSLTQDFAALSYVWGQNETLKATKGNIATLMQPGSIATGDNSAIPRTIQDAMLLCKGIGQRYLWVDRLCIVQDDFEEKDKHLEAMAALYAKAAFTIVAAAGSHADHGLCGISQSFVHRESHLIRLPSHVLLKASVDSTGQENIADSIWSKRAWTFQEHVFSRRLLYFDTFVSFICFSDRWSETWDSPMEIMDAKERELKHSGKSGKLFVLGWPSLEDYAAIVKQYNQRHLTYDADVVDAFAGAMMEMGYAFPAGFFGGLSEFYFTICLLWQPLSGMRPRFVSPETSHLPSWSWLGWSGKLDLDFWTRNTDSRFPGKSWEVKIAPLITFYKDENKSKTLDDSFWRPRDRFTKNLRVELPQGWKRHAGESSSSWEPFYTYHGYYGATSIDSSTRFRYPVPPFQRPRDVRRKENQEFTQYLYFNTQKIRVMLGNAPKWLESESASEDSTKFLAGDVEIVDRFGSWAGFLRINLLSGENLPEGNVDLISIAQGCVPTTAVDDEGTLVEPTGPLKDCIRRTQMKKLEAFEFYFVLWIEKERGIWRRRALGVVSAESWESSNPENIDISLG